MNRFVMPEGVASPALGNYPEQKIADAMRRDIAFYSNREIELTKGKALGKKLPITRGRVFPNRQVATFQINPLANRSI